MAKAGKETIRIRCPRCGRGRTAEVKTGFSLFDSRCYECWIVETIIAR